MLDGPVAGADQENASVPTPLIKRRTELEADSDTPYLPIHVRHGPLVAGMLLLAGGGFTLLILAGAMARSWGFVDTEDGLGIFVMGMFNLVLASAGTVGGVFAVARRKWRFALLGGLLGIFIAPHLSIPAVLLLFFAEDGFQD